MLKNVIPIAWPLVGFTLFLLIIRLTTRIRLRKTIEWQWLSDVFAFLSWFCLVGTAIEFTLVGIYNLETTSIPSQLIFLYKIRTMTRTCFLTGIYSNKLTVIYFYKEIMPRRISECTAVVLNAFVWLVMLCWILTIAEFYGACPKVTDMWSLSQADDPSLGSSGTNVRGRKCIEWNKNKGVEYTLLGLHLLLDLLVYLFPFHILRSVTLPRKDKFGAAFMLFIGFINIVNALAYFLITVFDAQFGLWPDIAVLWELACCAVVVCLPSARKFWINNILTWGKRIFRRG